MWPPLTNKLNHGLSWLQRKDGFSFIDVLVATAVLVVSVSILGSALIQPLHNQQDANKALCSAFLAQEKAEELKSVPWDQLVSETEADVPGYPGFKRSVEIETIDGFTKRVTVRVTYPLHGSGRGIQAVTFERTVDF